MRFLVALLVLLAGSPAFAAFGSVGTFLSANDGTGATSWAPTTGAQLDSGNVGVCILATDETGTQTANGDYNEHTSVTDAAGNTWNKAREFGRVATSTVANGANLSMWWTKATANLTSGAAVTFNFSASTVAKAATCWEFTVTDSVQLAAGANDRANAGSDPGVLSDATGVSDEYLFVRGTACEHNTTTYTADTDYTEFSQTNATYDGGSVTSSMGARGEFRIATEATSAESDPTWVAADCASSIIALDEYVAGGATTAPSFWGNNW